NAVNYAVGLTRVPVLVFALGTAIGTAPRAFAYTALGGTLGDLTSWQSVAAVTVLVVMGAAGLWLGGRDPELRAALRRRRARGTRRRAVPAEAVTGEGERAD
ncbi:MAG TPA: hypothetical protein VGD67_23515, partial [Pseudonocardiaceae bacterium]